MTAAATRQAQPSGLRPMRSNCTACGRPVTRLSLDDDPEHYGPTRLDELGGLTRYLSNTTCGKCDQTALIARLFPKAYFQAPESPKDVETRTAREAAAGDPPPSKVLATRGARLALARHALPGRDLSAAGSEVLGDPAAGDLVSRFEGGDYGSVGLLAGGLPDDSPLATPLDRNAASIAAGSGSVRGSYDFATRDKYGSVVDSCSLAVWAELGPGGSTTLVCLAAELQG